MEEDFLELSPPEINLDEIEGRDPMRARFIRGYLKEIIS